ncbi:hypothetical protein Pa4123_42420 [Phytohabitans aurantiacus]|uniref:Uncharacterized protein n=1 Tax=Phytohabitans aurantiacus TaxID=3016789 RepID=A0ABQ5QYG4_9ACTN|nr:hypothetical protein Pa4123_42420 [Phytohabitans aurantiacus]
MPIARQPRVEIRTTSGSSPYCAAHHGGAAGYRKYVIRPVTDRNTQRRMNAAQRGREVSHSTTATVSAVTKCEKYTQLTSTSHQYTLSGSYRCCCSHTVGTSPPVAQPNIHRSKAISSSTCGVASLSANPRDRL